MGPTFVADSGEPTDATASGARRNPCRRLEDRARRLRDLAAQAPGPLAIAYRRRACELELLAAVTWTPPYRNAL